jgi:tight adherence protein B
MTVAPWFLAETAPSRAALMAALAAALGVLAAWELLAAAEGGRITRALGRAAAPLARAGRHGREPTAPERRRMALTAAAALAAAGWMVAGPLAAAVLACAGPWLAIAAVRARRRRYLAAVQAGAPAVARALADALAGGHSIRGAVAAAGGGVGGPAGAQLGAAARRLELGETTEAALEGLREAAGGGAYDAIVAAALLQRQAGGDLARLLRSLATTLEDSARLERDARAATAQARFTGTLVVSLPAGAALLAELADPGYLASLVRAPLTAWLAGCALVFQLAAVVAIRRLARVARR